MNQMTPVLWWLLFVNIFIGVIAQILLKSTLSGKSIVSLESFIFEAIFDWKMIVAVICYFLNLVIYIYLLSKVNLGYIFTMQVALAIIAVNVMGVTLFSEPVNIQSVTGILLIVSGIWMLNSF